MSRLAKKPIVLPPKTAVTVADGVVKVQGPKGELSRATHPSICIAVGAEGVAVSSKGSNLQTRALIGTYASHLRNMVEGVNQGFSKKLLVEGVGYKWDVSGKMLTLNLGFSHPVKMDIPAGLEVKADKG